MTRFLVGENVVVLPKLRPLFGGRRGIVVQVLENRHFRTLDKYGVKFDLFVEHEIFWDIELAAYPLSVMPFFPSLDGPQEPVQTRYAEDDRKISRNGTVLDMKGRGNDNRVPKFFGSDGD